MLDIDALSKSYEVEGPPVLALQNISLHVARGQRLVLLGASGSGKSTLLRCIAGLEEPDAGSIFVDGTQVTSAAAKISVLPWKRGLGMVFQSFALWPHMTALENVLFPLANLRRGMSRTERADQALEALRRLEIAHLAARYPGQLSGGEQQRVALARALVARPKLLLMDEPLSSLDPGVRGRVRDDLVELLDRDNITAIVVTHDQADALVLGHNVAVMHAGALLQCGSPRDIYDRPASARVAECLGLGGGIECTVRRLSGPACMLQLPGSAQGFKWFGDPGHESVHVLIREEACAVLPQSSVEPGLVGIVRARRYAGRADLCGIDVDGTRLRVRVDPALRFGIGDTVKVSVAQEHVRIFP